MMMMMMMMNIIVFNIISSIFSSLQSIQDVSGSFNQLVTGGHRMAPDWLDHVGPASESGYRHSQNDGQLI